MFEALTAAMGPTGIVWLTGMLVFVSVASVLYATIGMRHAGPSGVARLGLGGAEDRKSSKSKPGSDRRKQIQEQLKRQEQQRKENSKVSMTVMLERSGMKLKPAQLYMIGAAVAAVFTFLLILFGVPALYAAGVFPVLAYMIPQKLVKRQIARQQKKFTELFPDAIDVLVRGVRTGLPVNEGMRLVAREMPQPLAGEFGLVTDATAFGVSLDDALDRFYARVPLSEVNFFNIVLNIQKKTGGNLSEALGNLSQTLRDRKKLRMKIKALSSEAKASAMIIGAMPFVLGLLIYLVSPDYISLLFTTSEGNMMMAGGGLWMSIGIFVMRAMINIEI